MLHTLLFFFTLGVLLVCAIAASTSLSAYFVSQRRAFLASFIGFIVYFFDVALVFHDDFLVRTATLDPGRFWTIGHPVESIVTGAGCLACLWLTACFSLEVRGRVARVAPIALYAVASALVFALVSEAQWREFLFYSMREVMLFAGLGFFALRMLGEKDPIQRARFRRMRLPMALAALLTAGIVAENVYFQLLFDPTLIADEGAWFFAERNIFENLLCITFAIWAIVEARRTLMLRVEQLPKGESVSLEEQISRTLPLFARKHGLSEREAEVLRCILRGYENQRIATELHLAVSTVKVHVHNILKKAEAANRQELGRLFWSE